MLTTTTDPISRREVYNPESRPFVIEGEGRAAVKIYFESEDNRKTYLDNAIEHAEEDFTTHQDNPDAGAAHSIR